MTRLRRGAGARGTAPDAEERSLSRFYLAAAPRYPYVNRPYHRCGNLTFSLAQQIAELDIASAACFAGPLD